MPKGIMYVETMPVSPEREAEYHKWYNGMHLPQITSVEGIVSARRLAPSDGNGPFIAIYELDCDDLDAAIQRLRELGATGTMTDLENLAMEQLPFGSYSYRVPRSSRTQSTPLPAVVPSAANSRLSTLCVAVVGRSAVMRT